MTRTFLTAIVTLTLLGSSSLSRVAMAGGPSEDEAFETRIFGKPIAKDAAYACFTRVYDPDHLARHPEQNVRTMTLLVKGFAEGPFYRLGLDVIFRGKRADFQTSGDCGSIHDDPQKAPNTVHCGVACDGGAIDVSLKDRESVLVAIPDGARMGGADVDDGTELAKQPKRFGADDKLFRLDRASMSECLPLASDDVEKAAMAHQ